MKVSSRFVYQISTKKKYSKIKYIKIFRNKIYIYMKGSSRVSIIEKIYQNLLNCRKIMA